MTGTRGGAVGHLADQRGTAQQAQLDRPVPCLTALATSSLTISSVVSAIEASPQPVSVARTKRRALRGGAGVGRERQLDDLVLGELAHPGQHEGDVVTLVSGTLGADREVADLLQVLVLAGEQAAQRR